MNEITDQRKLFDLGIIIQDIPITQNPALSWRMYKAWELSGEWYQVEIGNQIGHTLRGVLDAERRLLYLDMNSLMFLVEERIIAQLDAFNAGHHWRYKGL